MSISLQEFRELRELGFTPDQIVAALMASTSSADGAASTVAAPPKPNTFFSGVIVARALKRAARVAAGTHKVAACGHVVRAERTTPKCKACTWKK